MSSVLHLTHTGVLRLLKNVPKIFPLFSFSCPQSTLSEHLEALDISIEEFYKDIRIIQDTSTDPYLLQFLDCLVASADYESFYKVMWKEGQKHEKFHRAEGKSSERDVSPSRGDKKGGGVELEGEAKPSRAGGAKDEGDEKDSKSSGPSEK